MPVAEHNHTTKEPDGIGPNTAVRFGIVAIEPAVIVHNNNQIYIIFINCKPATYHMNDY